MWRVIVSVLSEASHYAWKSKFGGVSVSDAKRLKELEARTRG